MSTDKYLKNIHSPADIKDLSYAQLNELAAEIRTVLIDTVSKNGGHLASNLGVVELTLAMHKEFDSPRDKFVWDVGHQAYTHKLLTGRYERFHTLRQEGGLSGFCRPEESADWYEKLWKNSVELFRSMEIPVRQLNCCSGDLADLKVKSCDIEAWSPRQQKYFEVCSCSNLGDAQARRLHIRIKGKDGKTYLAHTLNNTCVAPPRMLIAFLENHLQADGSVTIPKVLQPYMGGLEVMVPVHKK